MITGDARTGSNMLAQALNTHPEIRCFREVFHRKMDYVDYFVDGYDPHNRLDVELRNTDPVRFLEARIFGEQPAEFKAVGFKYLYGHFWGQDPLTDHLRADTGLHVIHLKRRNMLRSLVSVRLAEMTNRWIEDWGLARTRPFAVRASSAIAHPWRTLQRMRDRRGTTDVAPKPQLTLMDADVRQWFLRTSHEVSRTDGLFHSQPKLELFYEDMDEHRDAAFARAQEFLGVNPRRLAVSLRKQNPEPLRELIANYEELRRAFAGTPEEAFFDA
jgi:hypothetical protein